MGKKNAYDHNIVYVHDSDVSVKHLILLQVPPDDKHSLAVYFGCHLLDSAITLKTMERIAILG